MDYNVTNKIVDICSDALAKDYVLGTNDCNILALKILDLLAGTDYVSTCTYDTLRKGKNQLKKLGVEYTSQLILPHTEQTEYPIPGDIWIDDEDPLQMSVYVSNRILVVDEGHNKFKLDMPRNGKFYRIKRK
ncbi:DUF6950 family protein [Serratia proteamaculans]|uniref:DUF6950 family protein n=1 Tax=Serratia proteamaculans TaxID=28151 RepID=UPI0010207111|nr:ornithine carbamoyltransferase [Serratia proteamaculans]RYM52550.1 hypothetical protein BSQ97_05970 [Serratia proteamaculans]